MMMTTEPKAKESKVVAAVVILIVLTAVEVDMMLILHLSSSLFENLKFLVDLPLNCVE